MDGVLELSCQKVHLIIQFHALTGLLESLYDTKCRGAIGSKTGKIAVLPGFRKIKRSSGRVHRHVIGVLSGLGVRALSWWPPCEEI